MNNSDPARQPASVDADTSGAARPASEARDKPSLPHEQDESSSSQAAGAPSQDAVGKKAFDNATDGTQDTDRGPVVDQVYNDRVAPGRGDGGPRQ